MALSLKPTHLGCLVVGHYLGDQVVGTHCDAYELGCPQVVACQQGHAETLVVEGGNCGDGGVLEPVGHHEDRLGLRAPTGKHDRGAGRLSCCREVLDPGGHGVEQPAAPHPDLGAVDRSGHADSRGVREADDVAVFLYCAAYGLRYRVL